MERQSQRLTTGSHSTNFLPPTPTQARAAETAMTGRAYASAPPPPEYLQTRFARLLVSLRKITQDLPRSVYSWLPQQDWSVDWTDAALYEKYGITEEEVAFIESMIRPMGTGAEAAV